MEFAALEPYRDRAQERKTLERCSQSKRLVLIRCGRFHGATFVLTQDSGGQVEFSLRGVYGRKEKRALTRALGLDLTRPPEYVRDGNTGELWVFPGRRVS